MVIQHQKIWKYWSSTSELFWNYKVKANFDIVFKKPGTDTLQEIRVEEPEQRFTLTGLKIKEWSLFTTFRIVKFSQDKTKQLSEEVKEFRAEIY